MNATQLAQRLVRFETINLPGDELPVAEFLAGLLRPAGFACVLHPLDAGRASVVATIGAPPYLAFSGHMDVVPLGAAEWNFPPFAADIVGGRLRGRGACDMKGGLAALVCAALALAPRIAAGGRGLCLIISAGEERGCLGARQLAATPGALPPCGAVIVAEPTANAPLLGHKGVLWIEGLAQGVTAHGSMPERGVNAVYKAARASLALAALDWRDMAHPVLGTPTVNVGWLRGGLNVNSVPDCARMGVDCRVVPGVEPAAIMARLDAACAGDAALTVLDAHAPVWTDPAAPFVAAVLAVAGHSAIGGAPYFTDAGALTPALGNPPTLIWGPGEPHMAHQTDETCPVAQIEAAAGAFETVARDWCGL